MEDSLSTLDLTELKPVQPQKTILLVNNFIANSSRFLNSFSQNVEKKLADVSNRLSEMEVVLVLLEEKLNSVPEIKRKSGDKAGQENNEALQTSGGDSGESAAGETTFPSLDALPDVPQNQEVFTSKDSKDQPPATPPIPEPPSQESPEESVPVEDPTLAEGVPAQEHPEYAGYFKMKRVGVPEMQVKMKMGMLGLDSSVLDDPNRIIPLESSGPDPTDDSMEEKPVSRAIFDKYDADHSGSIDFIELKYLCFDMGYFLSDKDIEHVQDELDLDGNMLVEYSEFLRWWERSERFSHLPLHNCTDVQKRSDVTNFFEVIWC
mmetsp:Transcript_13183/g.17377  ORF Transcript_13183/g.17377 Transcript_13183/m.17377 type:complete len:320 (-) Transcript_13183:304-1263(-)